MRQKQLVKSVVLLGMIGSVAHATTYVWDGGSGGLDNTWSQAANWSPNGAPAENGDVVVIDATAQATSVVDSGLTYTGTHFNVGKLTIEDGITLEVNQKCLAEEMVISGTVTIKGSASLDAKKLTIGGETVATIATKQGTNTLSVDSTASE